MKMKKKILVLILVSLLVLSNFASAESGQVKVRIPSYDVFLNGTQIDNTIAEYPMLEYKGITYFPMTWNYSNSLGLETSWNNDTGLSIMKKGIGSTISQTSTGSNKLGSSCTAQIPNFTIKVNNKEIDNTKEEYPILNYKSVTYFPLTWRFTVDEFGWTSTWNDDIGLTISSASESSTVTQGNVDTTEEVALEETDSTWNLPFSVNFDYPEDWTEASNTITEEVVELGSKAMNFSEEEVDLAMKTRIAQMTLFTKYPLMSPPPEGNTNVIFMVERNYSFDEFQTVNEYIDVLKTQLVTFETIDTSQEPTPYKNPNGIEFVKQNIINNMMGVEIQQEYYITKVDNYFVTFIVSAPTSVMTDVKDETNLFIESAIIE